MITLYHGDCLEEMKKIPDSSIDCIICDLPYGSTTLDWDVQIPFDLLWNQYNRIIKDCGNIVLFSSGKFTYDLYNSNKFGYRYKLVWKKNVPTGMSSAKYMPMRYYEEILIFKKQGVAVSDIVYNPQMKDRVGVHKECYKYDHYCGESNHVDYAKVKNKYDPERVNPSDVLEFDVVPNRNGKLHPTQKPVDLISYLTLTFSNSGDIILDNCMGSGTTGVACLRTGRSFIGIEKDETYFNLAKDRIEKEVSRKLF